MTANQNPDISTRKRGPTLVQTVMDDLSEKIRTDVHRPGTRLPTEPELMHAHGVSRTVIREAISRLQAANLVETRHGVGTFVKQPPPANAPALSQTAITTIRELLDMLELRISVETEAAGLAAQRRSDAQLAEMRKALDSYEAEVIKGVSSVESDFRFHLLVAQSTQNPYFENFFRQLGTNTIPRTRIDTWRFSQAPGQNYLLQSNREHQYILDAIARQDPESARAGMRMHLSNSRERLRLAQAAAENGNTTKPTKGGRRT